MRKNVEQSGRSIYEEISAHEDRELSGSLSGRVYGVLAMFKEVMRR